MIKPTFVAVRVYTSALPGSRARRYAFLRAMASFDFPITLPMPLECGAPALIQNARAIPLINRKCACGKHWVVRYEK